MLLVHRAFTLPSHKERGPHPFNQWIPSLMWEGYTLNLTCNRADLQELNHSLSLHCKTQIATAEFYMGCYFLSFFFFQGGGGCRVGGTIVGMLIFVEGVCDSEWCKIGRSWSFLVGGWAWLGNMKCLFFYFLICI